MGNEKQFIDALALPPPSFPFPATFVRIIIYLALLL